MTPSISRTPNTVRALSRGEVGLITVLVATMAFFLNHTAFAAGFNLSFADPLLLGLLLILAFTSRIYIIRYSALFFLTLLAISLVTALWLTPAQLGVHAEPNDILGGLVKLIISFLYFVAGTSIAYIGFQRLAIKWFSVGAVAIAALGVFAEATGLRLFGGALYLGNLRYQGFMTDPNFYAILTCAALVYFAYSIPRNRAVYYFAFLVLVLGVILSGSKTGLISLFVLVAIIMVTRAKMSGKFGATLLLALASIIFLIFLDSIRLFLASLAERFGEDIPQLQRTALLFSEDPLAGISSDGSGRDAVWNVALQVIEASPIFGVGIGSYSAVSISLFDQTSLAHNTYLQLAAEWGLVMTAVFLVWVVSLLIRSSREAWRISGERDALILRDMLIVFMIGSMSLSLNNARMLWLFVGMLAFMCYRTSTRKNQIEKLEVPGASR